MQPYTFHKSERLKSRKTISLLFQKGRTIRKHPLRVRWVCVDHDGIFPVQATFSIPKRLVPKAVNRNAIKRKIKEAYRLHKHLLYNAIEENDKKYALIFIYQNKTIPDYHEIEAVVQNVIPEIAAAFNKYQPSRRK